MLDIIQQVGTTTESPGVLFELGRVLGVLFVSFVIAMVFTPILSKFLIKYNLGKKIRQDGSTPVFTKLHLHKAGTPTMGGIVIWGTALFVIAIFFIISKIFADEVITISQVDIPLKDLNFLNRAETYVPIGALMAAAFIGLADDFLDTFHIKGGLKVSTRLFFYTLVAGIIAWWFSFKLGFDSVAVPFLGDVFIGVVGYFILVVLIIVASSFSVNEADGLDGLAGGVVATSLISLGIIAFIQGDNTDLTVFIAALIGGLLAFLWFNVPPARFFMGDTGSMSLGVTIGVVALLTNTAFVLPIIAFVLVLESASVLVQMVSKKVFKKKIFRSTPIHHHFQALGWTEPNIVMRFWIISAVAGGLGLVIAFTL